MAVGPIPSAAEEVEVRTRTPVKALRRSTAELAESPGDGKVDRRVRKTKSQLRQALTTLLLKKSFSEITVREISELADVNRGTFYTHYRDTADLLYQLENAFLDKLRDINVTVIRQDWEEATYVYLEEVFVLCYDNADIYTALVQQRRPGLPGSLRERPAQPVPAQLPRERLPHRGAGQGDVLRVHRPGNAGHGFAVAGHRHEGNARADGKAGR